MEKHSWCSNSASLKPGAYFQCPKLIANVRRDPSHPSSPNITSSHFGISSNDTWNIFVTILNPGVLCFWRCSPACVFAEFSGERASTDWENQTKWETFCFSISPPTALGKPNLVSLSCLYPYFNNPHVFFFLFARCKWLCKWNLNSSFYFDATKWVRIVMDVCWGQKPSLAERTSAGEAYNHFAKKLREEKPGRPFVLAVFCFKTSRLPVWRCGLP